MSRMIGVGIFASSVFFASVTLGVELPATGQTECFDTDGIQIACAGTGQDGEFQNGVAWPDPRFTDNGDGTVTDNLTNLIWTRSVFCFRGPWQQALDFAISLSQGTCGLADQSKPGDWRLPNIRELTSIIDYSQIGPSLPVGHPFSPSVGAPNIWSSSTVASGLAEALGVDLGYGLVRGIDKIQDFGWAWPVRDPFPVPSQCSDGIDNDGDGMIDLNDRQCRTADQDSEKHPNQ